MVRYNQKPQGRSSYTDSSVPLQKKRQLNGQVKTYVDSTVSGKNRLRKSQNPALEEIEALGGDRHDLELIGGVNIGSDSEIENLKALDSHTKYQLGNALELQGLIGKLGKSNIAQEAESEALPTRRKKPQNSENEPPKPTIAKKIQQGKLDARVEPPKRAPRSDRQPNGSVSKSLIVQPRPDWHEHPLKRIGGFDNALSDHSKSSIEALFQHASALLEKENLDYASKENSANSSRRFMSTIMSSGTLSDKISALTLIFQESPLHNMRAFENLIGLSRKRSRAQAVIAVGAVKDLLAQGSLLPSDRKLQYFRLQPGLSAALAKCSTWSAGDRLPSDLREEHLITWAFEDWLKGQYFELLKILESWCGDEVEYSRTRAVSYVWELLKEKPEQESNLLRLLTSKLGDSNKKIASKTSHLLLQLQVHHPLMKSIIISNIESDFLFRAGQGLHAKYYAIITLNQTILSGRDADTADKLLEIYFSLFVGLLKPLRKDQKQEIPKASTQLNKKGEKQGGGAPKGKMARMKEQKAAEDDRNEEFVDKMISAILTGINRALPFSNMDSMAFSNHLDTLFRIAHSSNFNTSIQALVLIQRLIVILKVSEHRFYRTLYESLLDPRLVTSSKQAMYLNLIYLSLKSDLNVKRVKAFAKRLVQICNLHQPPFICGVLYLIRQLEETFPTLKTLILEPPINISEEHERFTDVVEGGIAAKDDIIPQSTPADAYDSRKRDPEHSNADKSCLWELVPLLAHFHPSISLFASAQLDQRPIPEKPEMATHTLMHFLDRFVFKNAKTKTGKTKGSSIMQSMGANPTNSVLFSSRQAGLELPLTSIEFRQKKIEDVAADQVFFHAYFANVNKGKDTFKKSTKASSVSADQDEDEDEIWEAMVQSRPELEGAEEDDEEGFSDLDNISDSEDEADGGVELANDSDASSGGDSDHMVESEPELELDDEDIALDSELEDSSDPGSDGQETETAGQKSKEKKKNKKRKLKHLPTFASVDDYAELLAKDEEMEDL